MVDDVLLVEDQAFIAIETQMALGEYDQGPVRIIADSEGALDYLKENRPRAALLDFNLGDGETSEELALVLRERGIPVAFLTGYTEATLALPAVLADAPRFSKPCHVEDVVNWLESL